MIRTILILLFPLFTTAQDSLYISSDKPVLTGEDNPLQLGVLIKPLVDGKIKALKFYKTDSRTNPYTIYLWSAATQTKLTQVDISTSAIGWQRVSCDISVSAGQSYVVSVYNPYGRYGYSSNAFPRTKGNISATNGAFTYSRNFPDRIIQTSHFLDAVFEKKTIEPLSVKVFPDSLVANYGTESIFLTGTAKGYTSYQWEVLDSFGTMEITGLNTLTPVIKPKDEGGCQIRFMLTVRDANGLEQAEISDVYVMPNPNEIIGVLLRNNRYFYLRRVIVL